MNRPKGLSRLHLADRVALSVTVILMALGALASATRADQTPQRIVSLGSSVTEIIYALGEEDRIVARDSTSTHPPDVGSLPDVGYLRALSPEGVISVRPDLIVAEEGAGPEEAVNLLRSTQIPYVEAPERYSIDGITDKIRAVGAALGVDEKAAALARQVEQDLRAVEAAVAADTDAKKRVIFVLSTQDGRIMASGTGTSADAMITMAGGQNVLDSFEGYKPVTSEAVATARPDIILMMDRNGDHSSSNAELFSMPAFRTTPAAETASVVRMNGALLLGFGPRTAQAIQQLNTAFTTGG
ncbi:heme/hemin ABC transporter substrate-binding protein [Tateyamaria sp. SN6-1]|uniref:heme/hemin ABC transporter substrate-binding protein n=1 Tax=Tateyamaria sp. SN6-1 TaxID=3092148 RepID=UPI0039F50249